MIITKEYCDRCGKEVKSGPLDAKLFYIKCKSQRSFIYFRDNLAYSETLKEVCENCISEFWDWWKQGEKLKETITNKERDE
jgi:DNA-directed RNA polymerase subunit RPC12/RpoP